MHTGMRHTEPTPHCRHVLSLARCVVNPNPTAFTPVEHGYAYKVMSFGSHFPLRCGVVYAYVPSHPSSNGTRTAMPPHLQAVSRTAASSRHTFVRAPNRNSPDSPDRQTDRQTDNAGVTVYCPAQRQRLSQASSPSTRADLQATNSPPRHAYLSRTRVDKDPRISFTIEQERSPHAYNVEQCGVMNSTTTPGISTYHLQQQFVLEPCIMQ